MPETSRSDKNNAILSTPLAFPRVGGDPIELSMGWVDQWVWWSAWVKLFQFSAGWVGLGWVGSVS